jgi:hypothetical protein
MAGRLFLVQHRSDPDPLIGHVCEERKSAAPRVEYVFDIPYRGIHLTDVFPMIVAGQARVHQLASLAHIMQVPLQEPAQPLPVSLLHAVLPQTDAMDQSICLGKIAVAPRRIHRARYARTGAKDRAGYADGSQQSDHQALEAQRQLNPGSDEPGCG